jgi:hypothetical protein
VKPDADALRRNILNPAAGGGPSSPENDASYQRFRAFVKKKCDRDLEPTFPEEMKHKDQPLDKPLDRPLNYPI